MKLTPALFAVPLLLLFSSPGDAAEISRSQPSACSKVTKAQSGILTTQMPLLFASTAAAYCEADCGGTTIACSGSTCSAQDRDCPWAEGHVTCDGQTYSCGTCGCTPGAWRQEPEGCCTPYKGRFRWYLCNSSGQWEWTTYTMCDGPCQPGPIE